MREIYDFTKFRKYCKRFGNYPTKRKCCISTNLNVHAHLEFSGLNCIENVRYAHARICTQQMGMTGPTEDAWSGLESGPDVHLDIGSEWTSGPVTPALISIRKTPLLL